MESLTSAQCAGKQSDTDSLPWFARNASTGRGWYGFLPTISAFVTYWADYRATDNFYISKECTNPFLKMWLFDLYQAWFRPSDRAENLLI